MLEKLRVKSSKKETFNWVLLLRDVAATGETENAEAKPREDRPVAALREVFRSVATEHRKIIAVLPKIIVRN